MKAQIPDNEFARLDALYDYRVLDTQAESSFDDLTNLASFLFKTPISLVSLIDKDRQWFKSNVGLDGITETARDLAFCSHAILQDEVLVVENATKDTRFLDNPLVLDEPKIRFYAGAPLKNPQGFNIGTLCIIDMKPRRVIKEKLDMLKILSKQVINLLELKRLVKLQARFGELLSICSYCKKIEDQEEQWLQMEQYFFEKGMLRFSHGVCPDCYKEKLSPEIINFKEWL